jgi:hypothetical protein
MIMQLSVSRVALLLPVLGISSSGCLSSLKVDASDIEVTQHGIRFPAMVLQIPGGTLETSCTFDLDSANIAWVKALDANIHLKTIKVDAVDGVTDFDFMDRLRVTLSSKADLSDALVIFDYSRSGNQSPTPVLATQHSPFLDVTQLWRSRPVYIGLTAIGLLPTRDWSVDVTFVLDGRIDWQP